MAVSFEPDPVVSQIHFEPEPEPVVHFEPEPEDGFWDDVTGLLANAEVAGRGLVQSADIVRSGGLLAGTGRARQTIQEAEALGDSPLRYIEGAGGKTDEERAREVVAMGGGAGDKAATRIAKRGTAIAEAQRGLSPEMKAWNEAEGWDAAKVFASNPVEVLGNIVTTGAISSIPAIAAGAAGTVAAGPVGGAAGIGAGSLAVEYGSKIVEELNENGVDMSDPAAIQKAFADRELMSRIRSKAVRRGVPVALFDAASAGVAGKILGPALGKGARAVAGAVGKETGVQMLAGAAGEASGSMAAGDDTSVKAMFEEAVGELGGGAVEVAQNIAWRAQTEPSTVEQKAKESLEGRDVESAEPPETFPKVEGGPVEEAAAPEPAHQEFHNVTFNPDTNQYEIQVSQTPISRVTFLDPENNRVYSGSNHGDIFEAVRIKEGRKLVADGRTNGFYIDGKFVDRTAERNEVKMEDYVAQTLPEPPVTTTETQQPLPAPTRSMLQDRMKEPGVDYATEPSSIVIQVRGLDTYPIGDGRPIVLPFNGDLAQAGAVIHSGMSKTVEAKGGSFRESLIVVTDANGRATHYLEYNPAEGKVRATTREEIVALRGGKSSEPAPSAPLLESPEAPVEPEETAQRPQTMDELTGMRLGKKGEGGETIIPGAIAEGISKAAGALKPQETSTTPQAYTMGKTKRALRRWWLGPSGAFPKEIREILKQKRFATEAVQSKGMQFGKDLNAAVNQAAKVKGEKRDTLLATVNSVMEGDLPLTAIKDPNLQDATRSARNFLDSLSALTVDNGIVTGDMADTFRSNMGKWMKRYYAAFDPEANWNYDSLLKRAWTNPMKRSGVKDTKIANIVRRAEEHIKKEQPNITPGELEAVMRGLVDRSVLEPIMLGGGSGGDTVAKQVSSLIRRKDIAPEIKDFLGEEKNPLLRFEKSLNFMAQLIARHEAQVAVRDFGLANGLLSPKKTGRYTEELYPNETTLTAKRDPETGEIVTDEEGNPIGEYRARKDKRMDVFAGLYASPEFAQALHEIDPAWTDVQTQMSAIGKGFAMLATETKMAKVPLNPGSWVTNALGGLIMNAANGTINPVRPVKTAKLFGTAMQTMRSDRPLSMKERQDSLNTALRNMHARLIRGGVLNSSVTLSDLESSAVAISQSFLETNALANRATGAVRLGYYGQEVGGVLGGLPGRAIGGAVGGVIGAAIGGKSVRRGLQKFSQLSIGKADNYWKVVSYLDNLETYIQAFPELTVDQAGLLAADVTRATMPTYEEIPAGLRSLSRSGVIATFFQFNYEVIRNTINTAKIGMQEIKSGKPVLVRRGARRLAGLSIVLAASSPFAAMALSKVLTGDDDEKKREALQRNFVPEWDKNNSLVVTKLKDGKVSYVNHGYLIPYAEITKGVQAVMNGADAEEAVSNVFTAYADDFLTQGIHIAPIIEAAVNQKGFRTILTSPKSGSKITQKGGVPGFVDRFAHVVDKAFKPGAIAELDKVKKAATGELAEYGRQYTLEERAVRFMGLRENTYDLSRTLRFRFRDLDGRWDDVSNVEKNITRKNLPPDKARTEQRYVDEQRKLLENQAEQLRKDAATLGISDDDIKAAQKETRLVKALRD